MSTSDFHPGSSAPESPAVWGRHAGSSRASIGWCPVRTAEGQAELRQRQRRLTQRQRTLLFLVDGRRSEAQVRALALQAGATGTALDELVALGLIAAPTAAQVHATPAVEASDEADEATDSGAGLFEQFELDVDHQLEQLGMRITPRLVEGVVSSLLPFIESTFGKRGADDSPITRDQILEEARRILVRAVRNKAPLTGVLTLAKLRKARTREELAELLDEVGLHISTPMRHLSARQTLLHVRGLLLGSAADPPGAPA